MTNNTNNNNDNNNNDNDNNDNIAMTRTTMTNNQKVPLLSSEIIRQLLFSPGWKGKDPSLVMETLTYYMTACIAFQHQTTKSMSDFNCNRLQRETLYNTMYTIVFAVLVKFGYSERLEG